MGKDLGRDEVVEQGQGRINSLPNDVILSILSQFRLDFVVRTAVLSQHWRYLWTQIDSLQVCFNDLKIVDKFSNRSEHLLLRLISPTIRKFKFHINLKSYWFYDPQEIIDEWLSKICSQNVEEIELACYGSKKLKLPVSLFQSSSLVSLTLRPDRLLADLIDDANCINLPHLKKLVLEYLTPHDLKLLEFLINSCQSIEYLSLMFSRQLCHRYDGKSHAFEICLKNLRRLFLKIDFSGEVVIDAPKLERFELNANSYYLSSLSVTKAIGLVDAVFWNRDSLMLLELLGAVSISSVITLQFVSQRHVFAAPIMFPYLTRLTLHQKWTEDEFDVNDLLRFLSWCPVLEILICHIHSRPQGSDVYQESETPSCLLTHVKRIQIYSSNFHYTTAKLMEYLLCKARVLELLVFKRDLIGRQDDFSKEQIFRKELYECHRSSLQCKIEFENLRVTL